MNFDKVHEAIDRTDQEVNYDEYGTLEMRIERRTFNANPLPLKGWKSRRLSGGGFMLYKPQFHFSYY